ncbi:amidase family protein [Psychrobacter sp. S1-30-MNA-CIBAN-0213]|uniref:amidase family protein n=1 Tax=Psychrobacter sp. S1-30-MNA-CIBAN-0213 TaxID=3140456 RepID=UPI00332CF139
MSTSRLYCFKDHFLTAAIRRLSPFLAVAIIGGCTLAPTSSTTSPTTLATSPLATTDLRFTSVADVVPKLQEGSLTSVELTQYYLDQIAANNQQGLTLRAVVDINPDALAIARELDKERAAGKVRSPLHGLPILIKANIATQDQLPTTAGAEVLAGHLTPADAELVKRLRKQGAVILGKTNLSEWAYFRGFKGISGWSGLGGQTVNPYRTTHSPCGSSSGSGVAVAADFTLLAIGTETDGSIICPSSVNGIVGVKPTRGSVPGAGIIPIASSQDIAGPMTRYVNDAEVLLRGIVDPSALAQMSSRTTPVKRVVLVRAFDDSMSGVNTLTDELAEDLSDNGLTVINVNKWQLPDGLEAAERTVLIYEFKRDLSAWLRDYKAPKRAESLTAIQAYNQSTAARNLRYFGQEFFELADAVDLVKDQADYKQALKTSRQLSEAFLTDLLTQHQADAIITPSNGPAWKIDYEAGDSFGFYTWTPAAVAGYPTVTLRAGDQDGLPLGVSLIGRPYDELRLLGLAKTLETNGLGFKPSTNLTQAGSKYK